MVPEIALTTRKGAISLYGMSFPSKMERERTLALVIFGRERPFSVHVMVHEHNSSIEKIAQKNLI
jgi:hypothetical protein